MGESGAPEASLLDRFVERVEDYRATVIRVAPGGLAAVLVETLRARGARTAAVPADLPRPWRDALEGAGIEVLPDGPGVREPLTPARLDAVDGAVTGCALAVAETGTIVLDGGAAQGRRLLSLVPDYHLCVVRAGQVVMSVPDAMAALRDAALAGRPLTLISGPSATSDIELSRVEGVHGPRTLDVVLVEPDPVAR